MFLLWVIWWNIVPYFLRMHVCTKFMETTSLISFRKSCITSYAVNVVHTHLSFIGTMLLCTHFFFFLICRWQVYVLHIRNFFCAGNMIWRQVNQRMARVKLHLFRFHLKFMTMKKFFTILALKQPNSSLNVSLQYANIREDYWKGLFRINF